MNKLVPALALLLAAPAQAQPVRTDAALPGWLAGTWQMEQGADWADEVWLQPRGGIMLGAARAGFGPELQSWESMRIAVKSDGKISLFAQPRGAAGTEFPAVSIGDQAIEFANPAHDYPQRIRYWRQGQLLMAETARIDGSDVQRWNYRPVEAGQ